jgi:2-haloacid dehalogenase
MAWSGGQQPWVLLDLDGTLLDYDRAEREAVRRTLSGAGLPADDAMVDRYREVNARHWSALERGTTTAVRLRTERWAELIGATVPDRADDIDLAALASAYVANLASGAYLLPDAPEVVAELAGTHRIAYITNGLADVQRPRLAASELADLGEVLIISDEVGAAKPAAAIFEAALAAMGEPDPSAVTMVGDSLSADIAGGRAAGMPTVWVASAQQPSPTDPALCPDHRIAAIGELPGLLHG